MRARQKHEFKLEVRENRGAPASYDELWAAGSWWGSPGRWPAAADASAAGGGAPVRLAEPRHRRALLEDELPTDLSPDLVRIAQSYRAWARMGSAATASWLARTFEMVVADPEAEARGERHVAALRGQAQRVRELQDRCWQERGEKR